MKYDVILAGVGGQGVLSVSAIIASSAMEEGLFVKQSEVHGMSQRGGAVYTDLRLSDEQIHSDLIPVGGASLIVSMEPLECLRYLEYFHPDGHLITSADPEKNMENYPDLEVIFKQINFIKNSTIIDARKLAMQAGSGRATNMVLAGAASHHLPLKVETMENYIKKIFQRKGDKVVEINLKAFALGREQGRQ